MCRHLRHDTGVALIASKRYYFGVGGGTDAFRAACRIAVDDSETDLQVETLQVYDNGSGNIRELLQVKVRIPTLPILHRAK